MNVVVIGHVCIDRNISEHASYLAPGSPAMFLSKIFRQLPGCTITIVSPYGTDFLPYTKDITIYPKKPTATHTLLYENVTRAGKRTQKALFSEEAQPVVVDEELRGLVEQADLLYIAPITPNFTPAYLQEVLQYKNKNCVVILSPQGYFRQFDKENTVLVREFVEAEMILPLVDYVIVSEQDHPQMKEISKKWASTYGSTILVTTGDRGADVVTKDTVVSIPTHAVLENDIVDSVGSGDIFSAGFGYWYEKTKSVIPSVQFANKVARACLFFTPEDIRINYQTLLEKKSS
ncbi:MAG TPA: carbohydrate kinase family protein [Candidatus Saccharimonadales bacterium]|nr:carbohydrate kinase family protein [Candidatus Saccharimonadales bacterium]